MSSTQKKTSSKLERGECSGPGAQPTYIYFLHHLIMAGNEPIQKKLCQLNFFSETFLEKARGDLLSKANRRTFDKFDVLLKFPWHFWWTWVFFLSSPDADASCQTSKNERLLKMLEVSGTCLGPGDRCGLVSIKGKIQKNDSLLLITVMLVTPSIPIWITYYPCLILIVMIYILSRATVDGPHLTCRICCINRCKDGGSCSYLSKTTWKGRTNIYMYPLTCWAKKEDVWRMLVLVSQCTCLEYWFLQLWWFVYQSCGNEDDNKGSIWLLVNCNRHVLQIWELGYSVSSIHIKFQAL